MLLVFSKDEERHVKAEWESINITPSGTRFMNAGNDVRDAQ